MILTDRRGNIDLHGHLRRRVDGVIGVGLETRVHAARQCVTRGGERGLRYGVVGAHEGEDDHVAHGGRDRRGCIHEASGATNRYLVCNNSC